MNSFLGFDILRPEYTAALIAAPVAFAFGAFALRARRRARRLLVDRKHERRFLPRFSANRARLRVALAAGAVLFLGFSLLGPVRGYTLRDVQRKGLDLVVCIDTSRSMLVEDVKPNRLERAKREVRSLLDALEGDRAALIAFSGDVRNVAPLTRDRETVGWFLESLSPRDNVMGGTDIGGALERALQMFDGRTGAHEAIVLLTDGEDLEARGREVAAEARSRGIRIFVVGMGTEVGGKIPDGRRGFYRDKDGREVVSVLDDETLRTIAIDSGGAYIGVKDTALPLETIYEREISRLEGRTLDQGKERIPHDRYQWPLVLALACMLMEAGLRERRPTGLLGRKDDDG